jgi:hypothetical protein
LGNLLVDRQTPFTDQVAWTASILLATWAVETTAVRGRPPVVAGARKIRCDALTGRRAGWLNAEKRRLAQIENQRHLRQSASRI